MDFLMLFFICIFLVAIGKFIETLIRKKFVDNITTNKYVFITGCDTGFGNKLSKQLDAKGVHVIAACLTEKGCLELNKVTSDRVKTIQMDVTNQEDIKRTLREVKKMLPCHSALWGLVNNAGTMKVTGPVEWGLREDYEKVMAVNFFGAVDVTVTFLPLLKKSRGRIVNVSCISGRFAVMPGGHCESKFALEAFSDILRRQCKQFGYQIRVSIIEPAFFATNMSRDDIAIRDMSFAWNRLDVQGKLAFPPTELDRQIRARMRLNSLLQSTDIERVTNEMEHALFARWPKVRYAVGWEAKCIWIPVSYLPTWLSDCLT